MIDPMRMVYKYFSKWLVMLGFFLSLFLDQLSTCCAVGMAWHTFAYEHCPTTETVLTHCKLYSEQEMRTRTSSYSKDVQSPHLHRASKVDL